MSEKEIIKELKNELEQADYRNTTYVAYDKEYIRKIIDLYQKEKEKNNGAYHTGFIDGGICKKYEFQDKIKAIIEDLEEFDENFYNKKTLKLAFKNSLQELLEEGEENETTEQTQ